MELEGRRPKKPFTKALVKKILTSWHIYLLSLLYVYDIEGWFFYRRWWELTLEL